MSVIAKLTVRRVVEYGSDSFVELGCIAENDLMAAYATSEEDKLFSRYSPWGEIRLHQRAGWAVFTGEDGEPEHVADSHMPRAFYVMLLGEDEVTETKFAAASAFLKVDCYSKTKFSQDGSRVELREPYGWAKESESPDGAFDRTRANVVSKLSWKMHVDNPPAEAQFVPGKHYWLVFYDAGKFGRDSAIAAAHS